MIDGLDPIFDEETYDSEAAYRDGFSEGWKAGKAAMRIKPALYSHRNGETTPPEVEGWYWVTLKDRYEAHLEFTMVCQWDSRFRWGLTTGTPEWADDEDVSALYGPIPTPPEKVSAL